MPPKRVTAIPAPMADATVLPQPPIQDAPFIEAPASTRIRIAQAIRTVPAATRLNVLQTTISLLYETLGVAAPPTADETSCFAVLAKFVPIASATTVLPVEIRMALETVISAFVPTEAVSASATQPSVLSVETTEARTLRERT